MKLYNTLTRKVETLKPLHDRDVKLYSCGPTVYDYYHIGNLRNAVFNDTLRRTLEVLGYKVKHVMNITDVGHLVSDADEGEDKLEKGAKREGKTVWQVAEHYTGAFKRDMKAMSVLEPNSYHSKQYGDSYARATEFIPQQIDMIKLLLDKNFAYQTEQAIYFDVSKLPDYSLLSGQSLRDKEVAARQEVVTDPNKHSPHDFAVWFFTAGHFIGHSMHWDSPWGDGFPGWHLECSAIIHSILGDPIDIHTGGIDHIGTHHPNEMAQTEAAFGHPLSKLWVHNEFVLVDGQKMAKSKGNSYTLADIKKRGFSPLAYRLLALQAHYRSELNFSWDNLAAAQNALSNIRAWSDLQFQDFESKKLRSYYQTAIKTLLNKLADDLNTPEALAIVFGMIAKVDNLGSDKKAVLASLPVLDRLFGLQLLARKDISASQKNLISERFKTRKNQEWDKSDSLRAKLKEQGIEVRDTPQGQIWSRSN